MPAHTSGCSLDFSIACFFSHSVNSILADELQRIFETPEGVWKFGVNQEYSHLYAVLAMGLEETLQPGLDFGAYFFLFSELGSDLPISDPFSTFAGQELIIGTYAFCRILNDRVSGYSPLTVRAYNFVIHCSSLNEALPDRTHLLAAYFKYISY